MRRLVSFPTGLALALVLATAGCGKAVKLAVGEVNAGGGLLGRQIEPIVKTIRASPTSRCRLGAS